MRHKTAIFELDRLVCSPRPNWKWAWHRIPCECSRMMWESSHQSWSPYLLYFPSYKRFKMKIQKMCNMVPFLISCHIYMTYKNANCSCLKYYTAVVCATRAIVVLTWSRPSHSKRLSWELPTQQKSWYQFCSLIYALPGYKLQDHDQNLTIVYFIFCDQILPLFSGQPWLQVQKD